jgi:hypothetical protein
VKLNDGPESEEQVRDRDLMNMSNGEEEKDQEEDQ